MKLINMSDMKSQRYLTYMYVNLDKKKEFEDVDSEKL